MGISIIRGQWKISLANGRSKCTCIRSKCLMSPAGLNIPHRTLRWEEGSMALLSRMYPRGPVDITRVVRQLEPDGKITALPGWRWIHTPGHTEGHVSFFREEDKLLIAGDAFATTK